MESIKIYEQSYEELANLKKSLSHEIIITLFVEISTKFEAIIEIKSSHSNTIDETTLRWKAYNILTHSFLNEVHWSEYLFVRCAL